MAAQDFDRFRSFAERYIIARAASFRVGFEREDAWKTTLDAKTIYGNVARMSIDAEPLELEVAALMSSNAKQAGSSAGAPGATGAIMQGPLGPMAPPQHHRASNFSPNVRTSWLQKLMQKESGNGTP